MKKTLAIVLALAMVLCMIPLSASAAEVETRVGTALESRSLHSISNKSTMPTIEQAALCYTQTPSKIQRETEGEVCGRTGTKMQIM